MNVNEILEKYKQWLPDPPHLGMVRYSLRHGWAYIEVDDSGVPFLVNNHGGRILLKSVRWDPDMGGSQMKSDTEQQGNKFGTVCDTLDAIAHCLKENKTHSVSRMLDDVHEMLQRMECRENEMREALEQAREQVLTCPTPDNAGLDQMHADFRKLQGLLVKGCSDTEFTKLADALKEKAAILEKRLDAYRSIALELGELYQKMKGARHWDKDLIRQHEEQT